MDTATALGLVAVVLLIMANGYFVAIEFAYVAVRRGRIEALARDGDRKASRALVVLQRLSFMLSGAQLGITVTSLLVGFIAEPSLGRTIAPVLTAVGFPEESAPGVALTIGFLLATASQMIVGELAPKNLAIAKPEQLSRSLSATTLIYLKVAGPVIRLFDGSANRLLRAVNIEPVEELGGGVHPEELESIVAESHAEGGLDEAHVDALIRALDFGDLDAGAVAVPLRDVVSLPPDASLADLVASIDGTGHSRFPVLDGASGRAVGIVGTGDLLDVPRDRWASLTVADRAHVVPAVPDNSSLVGVLEVLRAARSQTALVVDEYGTLTGLITFEDLMEELVGEIRDEHDPVEPDVIRSLGPDRWWVAGLARLDEIGRETGIELPAGDYNTAAGLVLSELERLAQEGDEVFVEPMSGVDGEGGVARVRVLTVDGYVVEAVELTAPTAPQPTADGGLDT